MDRAEAGAPPGADAFAPFAHAALRPVLYAVLACLAGVAAPAVLLGRSPVPILVPVAAGIALALIAFPRRREAYRRALGDPVVLALAAAFASWLVSATLVTIHPGFSLWLWTATLLLLLCSLAVHRALAANVAAWRLALQALVVASVVACGYGVVALVALPEAMDGLRPRPVRTPLEAQVALKGYANVMPLLAPVLVLAGARLGGAWRALAVLALLLGGGIVYGTSSRAALAGYGGAALAALALYVAQRLTPRLRLAAVAAALVLAVAGATVVVERLPRGDFAGPETLRLPTALVDGHRQVIWGFVIDRGGERPIFGWGPGTSGRMPGAKRMVPHYNQQYVPSHPHNWLIQMYGETGLVGLALALLALGAYAWRLGRRAAAGGGARSGAFAAAGLAGAFFISNLANFSIWNGWWQGAFFVLSALALAAPAAAASAAPAKRA